MTDGTPPERRERARLTAHEMAVFAMLGTLMFISKQVMEAFPNIHLLGVFTVTFTVVYRVKALIPIYIFVFLEGLIAGFARWWIPYLYIWTVLWGATMLLPKKMNPKIARVVYAAVCGLHGLAYGTLYAPAHVIMFMGGDFSKMFAWISSGFLWDVKHAVGNLLLGTLIPDLSKLLVMLENRFGRLGNNKKGLPR